mmetsp:Transcript_21557/g.24559  ORF Transcript_21557/g.24559 Transcript_21557/m.24559 type:complete len:245 (-) Transcript_21557:16-750(-)
MMMSILGVEEIPDASSWGESKPENSVSFKAIQKLNLGSGVIDAAGGSGHVSMALGLAGVKSTVVDPRENVGKLPGRDRKIWRNAILSRNLVVSTSDGIPLCQPIEPYKTLRAWFGSEPDGVDKTFRHPDQEKIEVCTEEHELLESCSAIVALHPDEATDTIVDVAVQNRIPFIVIPCCVFSRLFPNRRKPNSTEPVCTYDDLIEYLMGKHVSIQKTVLPFVGSNIALWSTFSHKDVKLKNSEMR